MNLRRLRWRLREFTSGTSAHGSVQISMMLLMWRKATNATHCPVGKESFEDFLTVHLTSRLTTLSLDAENDLNMLFFKAAGVPRFISYDQFLRFSQGYHGQAGSGVRRAAGVSAKMPCTNQRTRPSVDFKEEFPKSVWGQGVQSDQDCSSFGCNRQIRKT